MPSSCVSFLLLTALFCAAGSQPEGEGRFLIPSNASLAPASLDRRRFIVEGAVRPYGGGQLEYMHPRPGALHVSELTSIAVREGDLVIPTDLDTLFDVEGRQSGKVDGRVVLARDNKTVLFYPDKPFVPGDNVTVQLRPGLRVRRSDNGREEEAGGHKWQFHIRAKTESIGERDIWPHSCYRLHDGKQEAEKQPAPMDRYRTLPTWSAKWRPSAEGEKAALEGRKADIGTGDEELYFFGVRGRAGESLIATRQGDLVWWTSEGKLGGGMFGVTPNGHLAHWDQLLNDTADTVYLLNATYQVVDRYVMGHGYQVDRHSITFDNDNSVVTAYTRINALNRTIHTVVQVQDADKNVLMEWRTVDDFRGGADPMLPDAPWDGGDVQMLWKAGYVFSSQRVCFSGVSHEQRRADA
mmetsp:Transcript_35564/g.102174  ORF Transcript_35564/g.102174 Transcript_35564/m.102174 type:complete len:410 (+) Transcript_35564:3-1232(+)